MSHCHTDSKAPDPEPLLLASSQSQTASSQEAPCGQGNVCAEALTAVPALVK
jgi:hypothetical protein